jgi:hypothetical protein
LSGIRSKSLSGSRVSWVSGFMRFITLIRQLMWQCLTRDRSCIHQNS